MFYICLIPLGIAMPLPKPGAYLCPRQNICSNIAIICILYIIAIIELGIILTLFWVLYVIAIQSILGKLPVVPIRDTGTIPHHLCNLLPGAPCYSKPGAGDGSKMWFVNSWALGMIP